MGTTKVEDRAKMDIIQMFFSFRGRINRKTFWLATLPLIIGYAAADMIAESTDEVMVGLGYLIMIGLMWPSLAVQTKRWHDRNKSGWWNLISLVPIAGPIWAFVELGFLKGTDGVNQYGLPPDTLALNEYRARINHPQDGYVGGALTESGTLADGGSVKNAWRGA